MIEEIIKNLTELFMQFPLVPAVKSVKYGPSALVPANDQPCILFNISSIDRVPYSNGLGSYQIIINIDVMLLTSVLTNEQDATLEAQKLLWQYNEKNEDAGFLPPLAAAQGSVLFTDRTGRSFLLQNLSDLRVLGRSTANNSRGALKITMQLLTII